MDDQSEVARIEKAVEEFFSACGAGDDRAIARYTTENTTIFWPRGTSLCANLRYAQCKPTHVMVGGLAMDKYAIRFASARVIKMRCRTFEGSALVQGFVAGEIVVPTKPKRSRQSGTWRMSMAWIRSGEGWKLEHMDMAELLPLQYLTYLPKGYQEKPGQEWPLVLFLHGSGQRGNDLREVCSCALPAVLEGENPFPFIAVCPQCPADLRWSMLHESLKVLLDEVMGKFNVDRRRVYLTGNSMGGNGTWSFASEYPSLFAAIAPVCGRTDGARAENLKEMPAWIFHGDADEVVPAAYSVEMVRDLAALGNRAKLTMYPGVKHDSWTAAYGTRELYAWLLEQKR